MACSRLTPVLLLGLAAVACGPEADAVPAEPDDFSEVVDIVPGSRLRPIHRVASDGTRMHVGWHDTLFDSECEFERVDGALRCVPTEVVVDLWLYADAACSERVLQDHELPEDQRVFVLRGDGCFDDSLYEIGEPVDQIYYNANGPCEVFSNDPSHKVHAIDGDAFVTATVTVLDGNGRIRPMLLEADDGTRAIVGAFDVEHDEEVVPEADAAGTMRWFSEADAHVVDYFADDQCTQRVALAECVAPDENPGTAIEHLGDLCGGPVARYELREESAAVYQRRGDRCEQVNRPYHARAFRIGDPLEDGDFAAAPAVDEGGDRLRLDVYATPEGEPFLPTDVARDRQLGDAPCRFREPIWGSGEYDCVPLDAIGVGGRYVDASCELRVGSQGAPLDYECPAEAHYGYSNDARVIMPIVEPIEANGEYVLDESGTCVAAGPDPYDDGFAEPLDYYLVDDAAPVPAASAVDVIEP